MEECKIKDKGHNKKEKHTGERSVLFFHVVMPKFKARKKQHEQRQKKVEYTRGEKSSANGNEITNDQNRKSGREKKARAKVSDKERMWFDLNCWQCKKVEKKINHWWAPNKEQISNYLTSPSEAFNNLPSDFLIICFTLIYEETG